MPKTKGTLFKESQNLIPLEEKKTKKPKAKKDPNAPKKGKSAFLYYVAEKTDECKKENPDLKHKEVISKLSKDWHELTANDKEPYIALANKDKERYKKDKEVYQATKKPDEEEEEKTKGGKRKGKASAEEPKPSKKKQVIAAISIS